MRSKSLRIVTGLFLGGVLIASGIAARVALAQTWQEPTGAPPAGNVPPPIWNIATTSTAQNAGDFHIAGSGRIDTRLGINTDITIGTCNPGGRLCVTQNAVNATNYGIYVGTTAGTTNNYGVYALAPGTGGIALYGSGSVTGVSGLGGSGSAAGSVGVQGSAETGVYGTGTLYALRGVGGNYGVYASGTAYAGYFQGNVNVTTALTVGGVNVCLSDGTNCPTSSGADMHIKVTVGAYAYTSNGAGTPTTASPPSIATRDALCVTEYGTGWRMANPLEILANAKSVSSVGPFWSAIPGDSTKDNNEFSIFTGTLTDHDDQASEQSETVDSSKMYIDIVNDINANIQMPVLCVDSSAPLRFTRATFTYVNNSGPFPTKAQGDTACSTEFGATSHLASVIGVSTYSAAPWGSGDTQSDLSGVVTTNGRFTTRGDGFWSFTSGNTPNLFWNLLYARTVPVVGSVNRTYYLGQQVASFGPRLTGAYVSAPYPYVCSK